MALFQPIVKFHLVDILLSVIDYIVTDVRHL